MTLSLTHWLSLSNFYFCHYRVTLETCDNFWKLTTILTTQTIAFAILTIEKTCDIWDTDYNSDNWEPEFMTTFVIWQLIVTLDNIRNSCLNENPAHRRCMWRPRGGDAATNCSSLALRQTRWLPLLALGLADQHSCTRQQITNIFNTQYQHNHHHQGAWQHRTWRRRGPR